MVKLIAKSALGSFLMSTGIMLLAIAEIEETVREYGLISGIKLFFFADLFLMVIILFIWFGLVALVSAVERWYE